MDQAPLLNGPSWCASDPESVVHWDQSMQTPEAKAAVAAYVAEHGVPDAHDLRYLECLDKPDILSRYALLLHQSQTREKLDREYYRSEMSRLREVVGAAGQWWIHCHRLRRAGRKTARLEDMEAMKNRAAEENQR